jgi:hypothetical protein
MTFEEVMAISPTERGSYEKHLGREAPLSQVSEYLGYFDSYKRTERLVMVMMAAPARRRLSIFLEWGHMCDAPWPYRSILADLLRRARVEVELGTLLEPAARTWFDTLPPMIAVYRGCQRGYERGLSWTTDRAVAEGFAQGKRCINSEPTLVTALIPKQHIFAVFLDRDESPGRAAPAELARQGHVTGGGRPYVASAIQAMLGAQ